MQQLTDGAVIINNESVPWVPGSVKFTEGRGEQKVRPMIAGAGKTEQIYARNLESQIGKFMLDLPATPELVEAILVWKQNANRNVVQFAGRTEDGEEVDRTWSGAALVNDYEVPVDPEGNISLEFHANIPI